MKKVSYPQETTLTLSLPSFENGLNTYLDENLTNMQYAINLENFSFSDGALKNGIGFESFLDAICDSETLTTLKNSLSAIGSIVRVFHFYKYSQETNSREDKLILVNSSYSLYYINLFGEIGLNSLKNISFTSLPVAVRYRLNGEDVIILSSETDNMVVWDGVSDPYEVLDAPKISSMALHYERLFATVDGEKNSVWFSDDLDPTNWSMSLDEAGFIELIDERGALLKVVSFLDYIYIFREYGISRLTAYGDQASFSVSNLFVSSGKIYANSVCVCGDKILFLARDGLYRFDGVDTTKILSSLDNNLINVDNQNASACYFNGSYYLACKFKFMKDEDDCENQNLSNALLEIDVVSGKLKNITHGVNISYITTISIESVSGVIALAKQLTENAFSLTILSKSASFLQNKLKKVWQSPTTCLNNTGNKKTLKKIYLETKGDISLFIIHGSKEIEYKFSGSILPQKKRVNIPINNFAFRIESTDENCKIQNLQFEFGSAKTY